MSQQKHITLQSAETLGQDSVRYTGRGRVIMGDKLTHNALLPWEELGRVKSCTIENVPAIGARGHAPEAYVPGCFLDLILEAVNSYESSRARIKTLEDALREIEKVAMPTAGIWKSNRVIQDKARKALEPSQPKVDEQ